MAEYIESSCKGLDFKHILVSPAVEKRLSLVQPSDLQIFSISAKARGKELQVILTSGKDEYCLSVSMGMSGYWTLCTEDSRPKHAHLLFKSLCGNYLCLVDARRFAKWKWADWSINRGPCPLTQIPEFMKNIVDNLDKSAFRKPIHLLLMDQRYFNGIGNYLRAEILFRANQDPFEEARTALITNPSILQLCSQVPLESYFIGGGQLKDWQNPFGESRVRFSEWVKCYGIADTRITDQNGRTFWYFQSQLKNSNK